MESDSGIKEAVSDNVNAVLQNALASVSWYCHECRAGGTLGNVQLPVGLRGLRDALENDHKKAHPFHCCTSDYFQITSVSDRGGSPAVSVSSEDSASLRSLSAQLSEAERELVEWREIKQMADDACKPPATPEEIASQKESELTVDRAMVSVAIKRNPQLLESIPAVASLRTELASALEVIEKKDKALEPFKELADRFDVEPYNGGYPDGIRLHGNSVVQYHNFLTLGDCRKAKAAIALKPKTK